jgi:non-heme chloroperoxidase
MRKLLWVSALVMMLASGVYAQDISGDWQGTMEQGGQRLRGILRVTKGDDGSWHGAIISVEPTIDFGASTPVTTMTLQGSSLRFTVDATQGVYEGKVSADGKSIIGTWKRGAEPPQELDYARATKETAWKDPSSHTIQFVTVEKDVKLEVLDWGGTGRPLIFLAGLGNTAHVFDKFAPKLTAAYHVYGITRRGFGDSSAPVPKDGNYSAERLGDDILAVMDALKLSRPVLAGHSFAGEELSSVGTRHPEKVAGLIYLDAAYAYAYYDVSHGDMNMDLADLKKTMDQVKPGMSPKDQMKVAQELQRLLPLVESEARDWQKSLEALPAAALTAQTPAPAVPPAIGGMIAGEEKFTKPISVPILAFFAVPHDQGALGASDAAARAAAEARDEVATGRQADAFAAGQPSARVVRLPHANHFVFQSNEADVLREMNAFLASLP